MNEVDRKSKKTSHNVTDKKEVSLCSAKNLVTIASIH
jgi:hypothetical protein